MKRIVLMSILALLLLPAIAVFASDVSDARYITELVATNSAVITKTNVISTVNLTSQDMIDSGMIADTVDDAALLKSGAIDMPFMPGYDTNPWMIFIDSIPFLSSENYYFYTGGATGGKIVYFPDTAGMTTPSIAGLGDNFIITLSDVWIDTTAGAGKYIFYKTDALELYIDDSTSGTINADLYVDDTSYTEYLLPNAAGDFCTMPYQVGNSCPNHYLNLDDPIGVPDEATTDVYNGYASTDWNYDWYNLSASSLPSTGITITSVQVFIRVSSEATSTSDYRSGLSLDGNESYGSQHSDSNSTYHNYTDTISRPGGGDWSVDDLDDLQVIIEIRNVSGAGHYGICTQIYTIVNWRYNDVSLSVSGIGSGEYNITISADEVNFTLAVGDTNNSTLLSSGVDDNANDIISFENDTVLYAGSQEIEIDGVQKQFVDWDYGATFEDQSGNGNDATPTFRTTSSDADVDVSIFSQYSTAEQGSPAVADIGGFTMIGSTPAEPSGLFDSGGSTFPGSTEIANLASATRIPYETWCYIFAFLSAMLGGAGVYGLTHSVKMGRKGSMLLMDMTMIVVLCLWIFGGGGVISGFVLVPFVIILIFLLMIRNPQSPVVG